MERSAPHSSNLIVTISNLVPKCVLDCTYHIHQNHVCMTLRPSLLQSSSSELSERLSPSHSPHFASNKA